MARNPTVTAESRTALQKYLRDLLVCLIYVWAAAFPPACLSSVVYYIQMYKKREPSHTLRGFSQVKKQRLAGAFSAEYDICKNP